MSKIEINEKNPEILLAVYGTLRVNFGNWAHILQNKSEHLGTIKTEPNFTMWGKDYGFPIVTRNGNTSIECDIIKVRVNGVLERVHQLEGCTGIIGHPSNWYDITPIETEFGTAYMYVQDEKENVHRMGLIKSGNWKNKSLEE